MKSNTIKLCMFISVLLIAAFIIGSCKKSVQIPAPVGTITTGQVFADSADANAAIEGIYGQMSQGSFPNFATGAITVFSGSSSDELVDFLGSQDPSGNPIYTNTLIAANSGNYYTFTQIWLPAYQYINLANNCISGVQASKGLTQGTKNQLIGEAEFLRAFSYFYLINLFGDVPYVTSIDFNQTRLASRTPKSTVYQNIIKDLQSAQGLLRADYSISSGQRIRANKWVATALLARVYLYTGDWKDAVEQATNVINNSNFSLTGSLYNVFNTNSSEAILQWNIIANNDPYNATPEGLELVPFDTMTPPNYYISSQLFNAFEKGDMRKQAWIDSTNYSGTTYYYPYKYIIGPSQKVGNATPPQYYTVLRLAEQYLIRAEANAQLNNLGASIPDINVIRNRAGLPSLSNSLNQNQVLAAVAHERQIEFFAEWGHRWLDLKRTGQVNAVMSVVTPKKIGGGPWKPYQQLYPIPLPDLTTDPNLTQNPGY